MISDLPDVLESDLFPDDGDRDPVAIKEAFGLPDRLPPLRLPDPTELAAAARESRLLAHARALAVWADDRELTEYGELVPADLQAAALLLGMQAPPGVSSIDDVPELLHAWHLACSMYFVDNSTDRGALDSATDEWPDGDDDDVLDVWAAAFGYLCSDSLDVDGQDDESTAELSFAVAAVGLLMELFLARDEGVLVSECRSLMNELAGADLTPARARKAVSAWTLANGEMADLLLDRWSDHGAVEVVDDVARLTSLAMWQMRQELADTVEVPLLPPVAEMTAADLVAFGLSASDDELERERQAWLVGHPAVDAARELLRVAADGGPAERMIAGSLAASVGVAAQSLWREALENPALRAYAKIALNQIADRDPAADPLPGLELEPDDVVAMLGDTMMAMSDALDGHPDAPSGEMVAEVLRQSVPPGSEEELFELMWRSANPAAWRSLELVGQHHPDKKIAKAARKAAYKARSRLG
jgi:hypothetical protein